MSELTGRVAIVTGGARGIGAAIVRDLVARGAQVVVVDNGASIDGRTADSSVAAAFALTLGNAVSPLSADIAEAGVADTAVALAHERFGRLDIIVNNAAILRDAFVFKGEPADYEAVLRTNLMAGFALIRAATPGLRERAKTEAPYLGGRIINIVSTAGLYGNFGQAAYASAKAGLTALARISAFDLARAGITANAVAPFAATRVTDSIVPANEAQAAYKAHALSVPAEPVARFVSFLCSPRAQHITGQLFGVRGREAFLFSQPRPVARVTLAPDDDFSVVATQIERSFTPAFTPLETDLDAFSDAPVV
jgi:NAD(P)-dependent dehydrogenase (short-subunit alcohol dehydrogenase family)